MFQLRDRLFAGTAHEMAHRKGPRVNFFEIRPPTERFSDRPKCSRLVFAQSRRRRSELLKKASYREIFTKV